MLIYCCSCIFRKRVFLLLQCTLFLFKFLGLFHKIPYGLCCNGAIGLSFARLRVKVRVDGGL